MKHTKEKYQLTIDAQQIEDHLIFRNAVGQQTCHGRNTLKKHT